MPTRPVVTAAPHTPTRAVTGAHAGAAPAMAVHRGHGNGSGGNHGTGFVSQPVFPNEFSNTPGLGFDYAHVAALNGGRVHRGFGGGGNIGFSGFLLSPPAVIVQGVEGQPGVAEGAGEEAAANAGEEAGVAGLETRDAEELQRVDQGRGERAQRIERAAPVPQREAAEYVFVRRDGGIVFAVAYSWENGTLRYVTRDGMRKSIAREALDMDATQQFNEQRGLSFREPV